MELTTHLLERCLGYPLRSSPIQRQVVDEVSFAVVHQCLELVGLPFLLNHILRRLFDLQTASTLLEHADVGRIVQHSAID